MAALVMLICCCLPAMAEVPCETLLTEGQVRTLKSVKELGNSYEVFTREVNGQAKVVALIGEESHLDGLTRIWTYLDEHFDWVAFSFRRKMDLKDKLFEIVSVPVMTAVMKFGAFLEPDMRNELPELLPHVRAFLGYYKRPVPVDPARRPFTSQPDLVNNPYLEVTENKVYEISRPEMPATMDEAHERGETVQTINLERGFKPKLADRLRNHIFSINVALFAAVGATHQLGPAVENKAALAWIGLFVWQLAGYSLHGFNEKAWYRFAFPFVYIGDDRRNAAAAPNVLAALEAPEINALAVVVERRRVEDLRQRLLSLGFASVERRRADRWPPRYVHP